MRNPIYQGTRISNLAIDSHCVILDVQVVGTCMELSEAHERKIKKVLNSRRCTRCPDVSSITTSYRGAKVMESIASLLGVGLGRKRFKIMTIRQIQEGSMGIWVH